MKHSTDHRSLHTNLLQALQKNKIIQGKLTECQRLYCVQLIEHMEIYNLQEKYNRELLYTWKKESYVRQLKKNLQEYQQKRFGVKDAYYEYQARNLDNIIAGHQGVVIPPSEVERRSSINAKYHQFLLKNPLQTLSLRVAKSASIIPNEIKDEKHEKEEHAARGLETTWQHIHAQSAVDSRRKQTNQLPTIHRSATTNEIRRNQALAKSLVPPKVAIVSSILVTTTSDVINSSLDEKISSSKNVSNHSALPGSIEPIVITSETLEKYTHSDLVAMRSVRRPRENATDLNMTFETRKRIYQINKRALNYQLCQRKCGLQNSVHFPRSQQIDSIDHEENLPSDINETTRKRYDEKQQPNKVVI